jgi:tol-pal system protein YbgF
VIGLTGCGTTNNELLLKQVNELNRQLTGLRKAQTGVTVTVEDLETRLFLVQDELDTLRTRKQHLSNLPVVRIEPQYGPTTTFDSNANTQSLRTVHASGPLFFDHITEDGRLIKGGAVDAPSTPQPGITATPGKRPSMRGKSRLNKTQYEAVALYKASYEQFKNHQYPDAIEGFRKFVERNPTHGYADNAVYWMGECFYDRGLWLQALKTFQQVIQNYPLGNKAPAAMLKVGLSHQKLKNFDQARQVLRQIRNIYPNSPVSSIAESKLKQLP